MNDPVNHPSHYAHGEIECIDAIRAALGPAGFVAYCRGCQIKYNWRTGHKDAPAQEQAKSAWYANKAEETIKANPGVLDPATVHPRLGISLSALREVRRDLLVAKGKLTTAEQERDELENKLAVALAQLEERDAQASKIYDAKVKMERERNHLLRLLKAALVKLHTLEVPGAFKGDDAHVVVVTQESGLTCYLRIIERGK